MAEESEVVGVILAGGRGRRMGYVDKCFVELAGQALLGRVIARFGPQVSRLVLSANGADARLDDFGLPVLADPVPGYAGPLAGLLTAMEWAQIHAPDARWIASTSVDTPFVPIDLVSRLILAQDAGADVIGASSGGQVHPVCALWRVDLAGDLRHALLVEDLRKVDAWARRHRMAVVSFSAEPFDPFFNINRPDDLARAEALLASHGGRLA